MPVLPKSLLTFGARVQTARTALRLRQKKSAVPAQQRTFRALARRFARTAFGRANGVEAGLTYPQFQARVPLHTYELVAPYVGQMMRGQADVLWPGQCAFYVGSSGTTTNQPQWLPATWEMLAHFRRAGLESLHYYCARTGHSRVFRGRHLLLSGSTALSLIPEAAPFTAYAGELGGVTALNLPPAVERHLYEPGADIAELADWPERIAAIVARTRPLNISLVAGVPSWLLLLAEALRDAGVHGQACPANVQVLWPNLECLVHGGEPLGPFHHELSRAFGPTVNFHEVYLAAEGLIAAQDAGATDGLRLMAEAGLFFEFLPLRDYDESRLAALGPKAVPLEGAKVGEDYVLLLTTPAGLCRYVLGDVVRLVSTEPARLVHVGRTRLQLSAFGEHVHEKDLTDALVAVCRRHGWSITHFHVAPRYSESFTGGKHGGHEWWIELRPGTVETPTGPVLATLLDAELSARSASYAAGRRCGSLEPPVAWLVMPGVFEQWMRQHGKWGGQDKMPRCRRDRAIAAELAQLTRFYAE